MRKAFACGHVGLGKWCHRCAEADSLEKVLQETTKGERMLALQEQVRKLRAVSSRAPSAIESLPPQ